MVGNVNIEAQSQALRKLATHLVSDPTAADDLAQDAWVDALRNPPGDDQPRGPWLRTVLRNRRVSNHRANRRRERRERRSEPPIEPASAEQIQLARELLEHLAALPEADRDILTLRYWEALSLHECAERLSITPSSARSRHSRALARLRARLDERTGGRSAWLAALTPWAEASRSAGPTGGGLSLASISVGGVVASVLLWTLAALDPACGAGSVTGASSLAGESSEPEPAAVEPADRTRTPSNRDGTLSASGQPSGVSNTDKHPCDMPIAPEDAPSMADRIRTGEKLESDEFMKAYLECIRTHGPPSDYTSPQENPDGSTHPLLSTTMAMAHVWPAMRDCYGGKEPARAEVSYAFRLHEDGNITLEDVVVLDSERLDADQRACVVESFGVAEIDLRDGDATQLGLAAGTKVLMKRVVGVQLQLDTNVEIYASGRQPPARLTVRDKARFAEGLLGCGRELPDARLHWDPETKEVLEIRVDAHKAKNCLASHLRAQLLPLESGFIPRIDADTWQTCAFEKVTANCSHEPLFDVVDESSDPG